MAMGRGGGSSSTIMAVFLALLLIMCVPFHALAATHVVGDSQGWGFSLSYTDWANKQTFEAGDTLGLSLSCTRTFFFFFFGFYDINYYPPINVVEMATAIIYRRLCWNLDVPKLTTYVLKGLGCIVHAKKKKKNDLSSFTTSNIGSHSAYILKHSKLLLLLY